MDQKLRDEFRAYKVETDDRLKRLEEAVKALSGLVSPLYSMGGDVAAPAKSDGKKS